MVSLIATSVSIRCLSDFRAEGGKVKTDEERRLMSNQRRFRTQRDEFKKRINEEDRTDDFDPEYAILRRKHREFEQVLGTKKQRRADDRGEKENYRKGASFRKGGSYKGRNDGGFKKQGGFSKKQDGFKRKGNFNRNKN